MKIKWRKKWFTLNKKKPKLPVCCDRWSWWGTRVQSNTWFFFFSPLFTKMMENPKRLHWTSGSANSSRARYLDKARPKEEANFCDLFIKSYFLSEPCVSWLLCFACNIRRCFGNCEEQQHKNAGTFFLALATRNVSFVVWTLGHNVWFLNCNEMQHSVTAEFLHVHLSPLLVCSLACVLSRW